MYSPQKAYNLIESITEYKTEENHEKIGTFATYPSSEIDDSIVSIGFECLDRELFNPEKCYDLLGKSGIRHARCQTGWAKCEKTPGVYDFSWLDDIVNNLLSRGVKPWFNVGFGNPIYMKNPPNPTCVGCVPLLYGEEIYSAWKRWLRAMSEHYSGRITEFERNLKYGTNPTFRSSGIRKLLQPKNTRFS